MGIELELVSKVAFSVILSERFQFETFRFAIFFFIVQERILNKLI